MEIFFTLFGKLIPLYCLIFLGYIAARRLQAQKETVARLLIYIIAPAVVFYGTYSAKLDFAHLSLPILFFALGTLSALAFLGIGSVVYPNDSTKNILAFAAGTGNTGYFGLPLVLALLGDSAFSVAVLTIMGVVFFENTVGFFLTAKGHHTMKESVMKVVRLPAVYAFVMGILLNLANVHLGDTLITTIGYFKGAYTLLGMMIIGMGLATVTVKHIDKTFIGLAFLAKFIVWPVMIMGIIAIDKAVFHLYTPAIYSILTLMSIVPLAANTVSVATELKVHPDKAAVAVLLSTVFALFYIPLIVTLLAL